MSDLPTIAKCKEVTIRKMILNKKENHNLPLDEVWNQSKINKESINELTRGTLVQWFRPGGTVENGQLSTTNDKQAIFFQRTNWVSFDPKEDKLDVDGFVKMVKGFDKKGNAYYDVMKNLECNIDENCCLTIYGKKITERESGFYMKMRTEEKRTKWYKTLETLNGENVKKIKELKEYKKK